MQSEKINITIFLSITTVLILLLGVLIILVVYLYQQKQLLYQKSLNELQLHHEKKLSDTRLEVQENMFRHISQEIHDNIGLTLSLAKLQLNTLALDHRQTAELQVESCIDLLSRSIVELKDISRSLNAEIINSYGLIKALENELERIRTASSIEIQLEIEGDPVYMDSQKELIIFRIIQEAFNNILKHSQADKAALSLHYTDLELRLRIEDNGHGFPLAAREQFAGNGKAGLKNMEARSRLIRASMNITSNPQHGTCLHFNIPV